MKREFAMRTGRDQFAESATTYVLSGRRFRTFNTALGEWSRASRRRSPIFPSPDADSTVVGDFTYLRVTPAAFQTATAPHGRWELLADRWWPLAWLFERWSERWTEKNCEHDTADCRPLFIEETYEVTKRPAPGTD